MLKENQIKLTEEIIETAYKLRTHKLAFGGLTARNESAFQLEFGHILKTLGQLYEFRLVDKFHLEFETYISLNGTSIKSKSDRARVDLPPFCFYVDPLFWNVDPPPLKEVLRFCAAVILAC
jgi:hypothetical protein